PGGRREAAGGLRGDHALRRFLPVAPHAVVGRSGAVEGYGRGLDIGRWLKSTTPSATHPAAALTSTSLTPARMTPSGTETSVVTQPGPLPPMISGRPFHLKMSGPLNPSYGSKRTTIVV